MKVNLASLQDKAGWEAAGVKLPKYDVMAMREKTCIIVTHRRAALAICDYAFQIDSGRMTRAEGNIQV